ncbi:nicotinamide N-methyltransferase-like [Argopecten irradians]|uniref:nicotinamide N-methyltransferase-like n=1 Tax=Argopecten irradians TaxID=31199 RepID=UPI003722BAA0
MEDQTHTTNYEDEFDSDWYLETYYEPTLDDVDKDEFLQFTLDGLHDGFNTAHVTGGRLLDVGTGPTVHSVISGSRHVGEIYLSDYAAQNRKLLSNWWKSGARSQTGITKYVLRRENSNESVVQRQNAMREKVRGVLAVDVHLEHPIGSDDGPQYFDVVTSSLCLEVASQTILEYKKAMRNVCGLLKPGGHLILVGLCGQSYYRVGDTTFSSLPLNRHQAEEILEELGHKLLSERWIKTKDSVLSDTKGAFVIVARINKDAKI